MDVEAEAPRTGKGGDEGGVDVDDGVFVNLEQLFGYNGHKARHHHNIYGELTQFFYQCHRHGLAGGVAFPVQHIPGDAGFCGPLQSVNLRRGGDDGGNLPVDDLPTALGVDEGL